MRGFLLLQTTIRVFDTETCRSRCIDCDRHVSLLVVNVELNDHFARPCRSHLRRLTTNVTGTQRHSWLANRQRPRGLTDVPVTVRQLWPARLPARGKVEKCTTTLRARAGHSYVGRQRNVTGTQRHGWLADRQRPRGLADVPVTVRQLW